MRHARVAVVVTALLAAAPPQADARPQLTRGTSAYLLILGDTADEVRIQGDAGTTPTNAVLELVPTGADAGPWSVAPANCTQDVQSFAVSCAGDAVPVTIEAGAGDDAVLGESSPVPLIVDGGPGRDYLTGGPGDDSFMVRDGEVDIVDCGAGQDTVVADADDALYGCENVDVPAPAPPPAPPPPAPAPAPLAPLSPAPAAPTPAPAPSTLTRIPGALAYRLTTARTFARFSRLTVRGLPFGARTEVSCRGRGCPRRRLVANGRDASFTRALRRARLRRGAVLEVRLTAPGFVGRVVRLTIARKRVRSTTLCLAPGAVTPAPC